jgi:hypothetical protein
MGVSIVGLMMDRGGVVQEQFAVPDRNRHAAVVAGPSKSSEGQYLYYLIRWL